MIKLFVKVEEIVPEPPSPPKPKPKPELSIEFKILRIIFISLLSLMLLARAYYSCNPVVEKSSTSDASSSTKKGKSILYEFFHGSN